MIVNVGGVLPSTIKIKVNIKRKRKVNIKKIENVWRRIENFISKTIKGPT